MSTSTLLRISLLILFSCINIACTTVSEKSETTHFSALSVADFAASLDWYQTTLGFELISTASNEQRKGALLQYEGLLLEVTHFPDAISDKNESYLTHGIFKLGFVVNDLDKLFTELKAKSVDIYFPIVNATDGRRTFGIKDIEGNIIQYFSKVNP